MTGSTPSLALPYPSPADPPPFEGATQSLANALDALLGGAWVDVGSSLTVTDTSGLTTNMGTWSIQFRVKKIDKTVLIRSEISMTATGTSGQAPCINMHTVGWTFPSLVDASGLATWADYGGAASHFESGCGGVATASGIYLLTLARELAASPPPVSAFHVNDVFGMNGVLEIA